MPVPPRTTLAALSLVAAVLAGGAAADPQRGWRPAADPFGNTESRRVVHYTSPGLLHGDKVALTLGTSGEFPLQVYDRLDGWQARARRAGWPVHAEVPGFQAIPDEMQTALMNCHGFANPQPYGRVVEECYSSRLLADGFVTVSALVDVTDLAYGDDPAVEVRGVGLGHATDKNFVPLVRMQRGSLCATDGDSAICAACFRGFEALAAGDAGADCASGDEDFTLMAVNASFPWLAFVEAVRSTRSPLGVYDISVQVGLRSGRFYNLTYSSDDLLDAIFAPRP